MSTTEKRRLGLPIGDLKQVLLEFFGDERAVHAESIAEVEEYALSHMPGSQLVELVKSRRKKQDSMNKDQENAGIAVRRTSGAAFSGYDHGRPLSSLQKSLANVDELGSDDELRGARVHIPGTEMMTGLYTQSTTKNSVDPSEFPIDGPSDPGFAYYCRTKSADSHGGRSFTSSDMDSWRVPPTRSESNRYPAPIPPQSTIRSPRRLSGQMQGTGSAGKQLILNDWTELTPAHESQSAETPLLRQGAAVQPKAAPFAPSHYHAPPSQRSGHRSSCGSVGYTKVIQTSYKASVPRIMEFPQEGSNDCNSTSRYMTPASGRLDYGSHLFRGTRGRRDYNVTRTPLTHKLSSCRPFDEVPYNANPLVSSPICEKNDQQCSSTHFGLRAAKTCASLAWRCKYVFLVIGMALWLMRLSIPRSLSALTGFTSLIPSQTSTGTLPTFCSMRRGDTKDCTPCPRRALCYEGRAECPTYYALEKVSLREWECQSYKEELERIAHEGFSRVVSYLRKIEKPVGCGAEIMSHVESRRDVLDLFDTILMPMLDERQKGLKDGLLQMYLTLLADKDRLRELYLEKEGSLHVTLASVITKTRLMCHLPGKVHLIVSAFVLGSLGLVYLNYKLR